MTRIQIDPEQAMQTASTLLSNHQELDQLLQTLASTVEEMIAGWDGQARQRFAVSWEQWLTSTRKVLETIPSLAAGIQQEKAEFEAADRHFGA